MVEHGCRKTNRDGPGGAEEDTRLTRPRHGLPYHKKYENNYKAEARDSNVYLL
jgi:hypothetical protein